MYALGVEKKAVFHNKAHCLLLDFVSEGSVGLSWPVFAAVRWGQLWSDLFAVGAEGREEHSGCCRVAVNLIIIP